MSEPPRADSPGEQGSLGIRPQVQGEDQIKGRVFAQLFGEPPEPASPRMLGRFEVVREVGAGGMGVVYAARDPRLDRTVAVKLLHADLWAGEQGKVARERLLREAKSMARLTHPNVVTVHEIGTGEDGTFVAMEYVRGQTLGAFLADHELTWRQILELFCQAGEGLAAAHAEGIVHRDFKPENVLIDGQGRAKVADFGLAGMRDETPEATDPRAPAHAAAELKTGSLTRTGAVMGTPAYMAPEQYAGEPADAKADQFAFAVSLYEALYGERPYAGRTVPDLVRTLRAGTISPAPRGAKVPTWVRAAVVRALAPEPSERWPDMPSMLAELARDPGRTHRRVGWVLGLVAVGAVAGTLAVGAREASRCEGAGERLAEVWDAQVRAQARAAVEGTGLGYAGATWSRVSHLLDQRAEAWRAEAQRSCRAAARATGEDKRRAEQQTACLDAQLESLRGYVDALLGADAKMVPRMVQAAASLPEPSVCADPRRTGAWHIPDDEAGRAALREGLRQLAAASTQVALGRYGPAVDAASGAVESGRRLGNVALEARALVALGRAQERAGDVDAGAESLLAAVARAEAAGDGITRVRALIYLVYVTGVKKRDFDQARTHAAQAKALVDTLELDPVLEAHLMDNEASVAKKERRWDAALEGHRAALELRRTALGDDHPDTAASLTNLGSALRASGDAAAAEPILVRAVAGFERALGPEHPHVAIALTNLGNARATLGRYEDAAKVQRRALEIREAALGPDHPALASTLYNLGLVYAELERPATALEYLRRGLAIREAAVGSDSASLLPWLLEIGKLAARRGEPAVPPLERALTLGEGAGQSASELAPVRFELARAIHGSDAARARDLARSALRARRSADEVEAAAEIEAWLKAAG